MSEAMQSRPPGMASPDVPPSRPRDPIGDAKQRLFPPIRNRVLSEAAEALNQGQIERAEPSISKYLGKHPRDLDALNLLADVARRKGDLEKAEELVAQCIQHRGYRFNYAVVLRRRGKFQEALAHLDELLRTEPENPLFRDQRAKVLDGLGHSEEAVRVRRRLTEDYPHVAAFWMTYGETLRGPGFRDECVSAWRKALELDPALADAYLRLSDLKTYRFSADELARMDGLLKKPGLSADARASLHFALGRGYGQHREYPKSFENYAKGNALRRLEFGVDPDRLTTHRKNCEALFTEEFFAQRRGWGSDASGPIFIVGLPRSGSTLLEQILSSHSAIEGLGELPCMDRLVVARLTGNTPAQQGPEIADAGSGDVFDSRSADGLQIYSRIFGAMSGEECRAMGEEYIAMTQHARRGSGRLVARKSLATFSTDKALSNFGHIGLIQLILPNAKIIDVRRHPLDCGWSCFTNHFPQGMRFTYRLQDIGRHYSDYVALMAHFERVLPGRMHRVIYENLVADPEREIRQALDYLRLPFQEQCLRFYENKRPVDTLSSEQVRQPLYKSGIAQWQPYEPWLGPLKAALGSALDSYPQLSQ